MTTLNDFSVTDGNQYVLAAYYNLLLGSILRKEFSNAVTMTTNLTLTDGDTAIQRLNCNGANRIVKMPAGANGNHPFFIINVTSNQTLTVQSNDGSITHKVLAPGETALVIPDGNGGYKEATTSTGNGWIEVPDTWTYGSPSTINIPTDGTLKYQKGMPIRFKQGGGYKYFNIASVTSTQITVIVNTDFVVANAAITDIAVSFLPSPFGFPEWFTRTATGIVFGTGGSAGSYAQSGAYALYRVRGKTIQENIRLLVTNVGSWTGLVVVTSAITALSTGQSVFLEGAIWANGVNPGTIKGVPQISAGTTNIAFVSSINSANLTWAGMAANDELQIRGEYQI